MSTTANMRRYSGKGKHHSVSGTDYKNAAPLTATWERTHWTTWRCSNCKMEQVETFSVCPMCKAVMR